MGVMINGGLRKAESPVWEESVGPLGAKSEPEGAMKQFREQRVRTLGERFPIRELDKEGRRFVGPEIITSPRPT